MLHKPTISSLAARMRSDIQLAILTFYCLCALALITPFAIFRLYEGNLILGVAELGVVATFVALGLVAWKSGKVQIAADLTAGVATAGTIALVLLMDISNLWTFSTLVGNFLMARKWAAILLSTLLVLSIGLQADAFPVMADRLTYLSVSGLVSLLGLIYATRINHRYGELSDMLSRDALTGALNRRALDHDLHVLAAQEGGHEHSLVMMDLDAFKPLNDNHGHDAGDRVLVDLSRIVNSRRRERDRFYRYGGDEFVLLLPDTPLSGARSATSKLREALMHELKGPDGPIKASMGVAQKRAGENPDDWVKRADDALLAAKRAGKDRVMLAD